MTQDGNEFVLATIHGAAAGEQSFVERMAFVYGSGGSTDEAFFTWRGDRLYELPVAWLHPQKQWGVTHFDPFGVEQYFSRALTPRCVECHNTWFEYAPGLLNRLRTGRLAT